MAELRLLLDPPAPGAWNMAVDEVLLETAAATGRATLRFYQWQEPTLSLGYFQSVADRHQHAASRDCPLVRRASGGGAIVHDRELTYSVAIPHHDSRSTSGKLYDVFHLTLIETLSELGVSANLYSPTAAICRDGPPSTSQLQSFLCFQRRTCSDIVCRQAKVVGSAQRRRRSAVLQHGSVLLARSAFAPELPGIAELESIAIDPTELATRWTPRMADRLGLVPRAGKLFEAENRTAEAFVVGRFAKTEHLSRR
jgi:lipoate-protein ligase A